MGWNFDVLTKLTSAQKYSGGSSFDATTTQLTPSTLPILTLPNLRYEQDFTIECFVNISVNNDSSRFQIVGNLNPNRSLFHGGNKSAVYQNDTYPTPAVDTNMILNNWVHLGIGYQASTNTIYNVFNGQVNSTVGVTPLAIPNGTPIYFFGRSDSPGFISTGYL